MIVGGFTYSRGEAGSNYVIGLGRALRANGCTVGFLARHSDDSAIRSEFGEFTCHIAPRERQLKGWRSALANLSGSDNALIKWLERRTPHEFDLLIAYPSGLPVSFLRRLRSVCQINSWKLAVVVDEWQGFRQFGARKVLHRMLATLDSELQRRIVNKKIHNILAISSFLRRYYARCGCRVIQVPPLIDAKSSKWVCSRATERYGRPLRLLFSGGWWRDRLELMAEAILTLKAEGHPLVLEFLGFEPNELATHPGLLRKLTTPQQDCFKFHGRVPVNQVIPITSAAHFGVLLRDRARWSDACFPSKLAEFQALGVPMICNLTSNLGDVLTDLRNALVVSEVSVSSFSTALRRALALTPAEHQTMKECSLACGATYFDFRSYCDSLQRFVHEAINSHREVKSWQEWVSAEADAERNRVRT